MKFQFLLKNCLAAVALFFVQNLLAHGHHDAPADLKHWSISSEKHEQGEISRKIIVQ